MQLGVSSQQAPQALANFCRQPAPRKRPVPWVAADPHKACNRKALKLRRRDRRHGRLQARAEAGVQQPLQCPSYDVIGLGQAMVDVAAAVDDSFLAELNVGKGERRCASLALSAVCPVLLELQL